MALDEHREPREEIGLMEDAGLQLSLLQPRIPCSTCDERHKHKRFTILFHEHDYLLNRLTLGGM